MQRSKSGMGRSGVNSVVDLDLYQRVGKANYLKSGRGLNALIEK